jgi:predicted nucleic acid-binding protein
VPHFVDTNIVIYAFDDCPKADQALVTLGGAIISVQVLNEFTNVCVRKLGFDEPTIAELISDLRGQVSTILPISEEAHDLAREISFRYRLAFYDSVLLASALLADCDIFYSEDLQNGLLIEDQLQIVNPFA